MAIPVGSGQSDWKERGKMMDKETVLPRICTISECCEMSVRFQIDADWERVKPLVEVVAELVRYYDPFGLHSQCVDCGVGASTSDVDHTDRCVIRRVREALAQLEVKSDG